MEQFVECHIGMRVRGIGDTPDDLDEGRVVDLLVEWRDGVGPVELAEIAWDTGVRTIDEVSSLRAVRAVDD